MGWFWGKSDPPKSTTDNDPLRDLDPSLRDFLSKESPIKYTPAPPPPTPPSETTTSPLPPTQKHGPTTPAVPPESLYPDGRYAHLWANYKSLSAIEAESKSDQEKLLDILDGYKERKAQIGRAAVENCVEEQMAVNECYTKGGWSDRFTMCRGQNKAFSRCYIMQSRFLKALGYLSTYSRPESVDEAIQMHADTLYHRMLTQEAAVEEAKAAGLPEPQFAPMLSSVSRSTTGTISAAPPPVSAASKDDLPLLMPETQKLLTPASQAALRERLKTMTPTERELEERGVMMEARAASETGKQVTDIIGQRKKRREEGKATAGDTISGWFGW